MRTQYEPKSFAGCAFFIPVAWTAPLSPLDLSGKARVNVSLAISSSQTPPMAPTNSAQNSVSPSSLYFQMHQTNANLVSSEIHFHWQLRVRLHPDGKPGMRFNSIDISVGPVNVSEIACSCGLACAETRAQRSSQISGIHVIRDEARTARNSDKCCPWND